MKRNVIIPMILVVLFITTISGGYFILYQPMIERIDALETENKLLENQYELLIKSVNLTTRIYGEHQRFNITIPQYVGGHVHREWLFTPREGLVMRVNLSVGTSRRGGIYVQAYICWMEGSDMWTSLGGYGLTYESVPKYLSGTVHCRILRDKVDHTYYAAGLTFDQEIPRDIERYDKFLKTS